MGGDGLKKFLLTFSLLILLTVSFVYYGLIENRSLEVEHLTVHISELPENLNGLTIVHLSDIHFPNNGIEVTDLIAETKTAQPDIILLTGDLIHRSAIISETPLADLVAALTDIAPTYSVSGNHEVSSDQLKEWNEVMIQNDVTLLENEVDIISFSGEDLAIAGVEDWHLTTDIYNTDEVKIMPILLLAHRPEHFESYAADHPSLKPDITFSGHAHGGQIRIPFIGPLFAPGQGLFPKYTSGIYAADSNAEQKLVVSRGLGNSLFPLRINNKPHLVVVHLSN